MIGAQMMLIPPDLRNLGPDVPEVVTYALSKALAKDSGQRFSSVEALLEAIST
jgi:hypothetical protein